MGLYPYVVYALLSPLPIGKVAGEQQLCMWRFVSSVARSVTRVYIAVSVADRAGRRKAVWTFQLVFSSALFSLDIPTRLQFGAFLFGHSNSSSVPVSYQFVG